MALRQSNGVIFHGWGPALWCGGLHAFSTDPWHGSTMATVFSCQWATAAHWPDFDHLSLWTMKNGRRTRFLTLSPLPEWKSSLLPFRLSSWLLCLSPLSFPPVPLGFNWILMVALLLSVAWAILIYIPLPLLMFHPSSCRLTTDAEHRQLWLKRRG